MDYAVFKWHFSTGVHFGTDKGQLAESSYIMQSDTLFSALCLEALKQGGENGLQTLYQKSQDGRLLFSNTMLYRGECYYLPKPILQVENNRMESSSVLKKAYKKLKYIPAEQFSRYVQSLQGKINFDVEQINQQVGQCAYAQMRVMVSVTGQANPLPYYINVWNFAPEAGLYVIVAYEEETDLRWVEQLMQQLGYTGVGGKKNSGLGKFEVEDAIFLEEGYSEGLQALYQLVTAKGNRYMTISNALPTSAELEMVLQGASYQVVKRGGFVDSTTYAAEQRKRNTIYMLSAGSCFLKPFEGHIYDVAATGKHAVYRYAKPLFLGVHL